MYYRVNLAGDAYSEYFSDKNILKDELDKLLRCSACPTYRMITLSVYEEKGGKERIIAFRGYLSFEHQSICKEYDETHDTEGEILKLDYAPGFYTKWYIIHKD